MHCPHCGTEHHLDAPCNQQEHAIESTPHQVQEKALAGLDNPFWKPEEPAA
jgi:hypothetical protein